MHEKVKFQSQSQTAEKLLHISETILGHVHTQTHSQRFFACGSFNIAKEKRNETASVDSWSVVRSLTLYVIDSKQRSLSQKRFPIILLRRALYLAALLIPPKKRNAVKVLEYVCVVEPCR
jgi:hypothetical protein